jgi:hypothetical protein
MEGYVALVILAANFSPTGEDWRAAEYRGDEYALLVVC